MASTSSPRSTPLRTCLAPAQPTVRASLAARLAVLSWGLLCYALTLAAFGYGFGFLGNLLTPTRLDGPIRAPLGTALAVDLALLALFAVQHSVMARPWFKAAWTRIVPAAAERATYCFASFVALAALFAWWQPIGGVVWDLRSPTARAVMFGLYTAGWLFLLFVTFLINHFDLFGLRQVWLFARGRRYTALPFRTPLAYRFVRHPLYIGWFMVFWMAPTMTVAHLVFAAGCTAYILLAIRWEERDLVDAHPEYAEYRQRTPKFVPRVLDAVR
jgi:methanethiol S-methyltransferase